MITSSIKPHDAKDERQSEPASEAQAKFAGSRAAREIYPDHRCRSTGAACLWSQCTAIPRPCGTAEAIVPSSRSYPVLDSILWKKRGTCAPGIQCGGCIPRYAQLWLAILSSASEPMLNISTLASRYTLHETNSAPCQKMPPKTRLRSERPGSRFRKASFSWGRGGEREREREKERFSHRLGDLETSWAISRAFSIRRSSKKPGLFCQLILG